MKKKEFYFVTCVRTKSRECESVKCRCIGFYPTLKDARNVILKHSRMISEQGYYQLAVIEKFGFGWYYYSRFQEWYRLGKKKAKRIGTPKSFKRVCNFGIG